MLYIDGASSAQGCGTKVILEKEGDIMVELSIKFDFPVSNNQAKYEVLIAGLQLTYDIDTTRLMIYSDSLIVTSQVTRAYQGKDMLLQKYLDKV